MQTFTKLLLRADETIKRWLMGGRERVYIVITALLVLSSVALAIIIAGAFHVDAATAIVSAAVATAALFIAVPIIQFVTELTLLLRLIVGELWLAKRVAEMISLELNWRLYQRTGKTYAEIDNEARRRVNAEDYLRELFGGSEQQ